MNIVQSFSRLTTQEKMIGIGVAVAVFYLAPKILPAIARKTGETAGEAAAGVVIDGATGAIIGVGKAVGVPKTNIDVCQQDIARGDLWRASFDCPATTFLEALWDQTFK